MTLFIFFVVNNNVFVSSTNVNNKSNFNVPKSNTLKIAIMSPRIKKSNGKPVGWSTTSLVATLLAIDVINNKTDKLYEVTNVSENFNYRLLGVDFNGKLSWKSKESYELYRLRQHWLKDLEDNSNKT